LQPVALQVAASQQICGVRNNTEEMSGAGRGRGWLNLPKSAEPPRPTGLHKPTVNNTSPVPQINSPYKELIDRMKEINLNDDGIMFNKKMKYVQEYWLQECGNEEEVKSVSQQSAANVI
jgi:hypothetical protein